jgi:NADPH-dependent 2,4-dienoyl-CoA reductase/sulfur reductase-like enzyme
MGQLENIVIVGASLAGVRAAETLRREGFGGRLTVLGEEPYAPYDRPPLSKEILVGEMQVEDVALPVAPECEADWCLGERAVALDTERRAVLTAGGDEHAYDGLLIATGSAPRRIPGLEPDGARIVDVRTVDDALRLRELLVNASSVLIIGAGFIGIEVASAARTLGIDTTIVTLEPPVLPAGPLASSAAARLLEGNDVTLWQGRTVLSVMADGGQQIATLDDGTTLSADVIVVAVGARPRVEWLEGSGLDLHDGVLCDATLCAVGAEDIVAAGDVARWSNPLFGGRTMRIEHWSNAVEQGAAAARSLLAGADAEPFASLPSFWSDHFGVRLQSIGLPALADEFVVTAGHVDEGRFGAGAYRDGELVGGVAYGMPKALIALRAQLTKVGVTG